MFLAQFLHNFYTTLTIFFKDQLLNIYDPRVVKQIQWLIIIIKQIDKVV